MSLDWNELAIVQRWTQVNRWKQKHFSLSPLDLYRTFKIIEIILTLNLEHLLICESDEPELPELNFLWD